MAARERACNRARTRAHHKGYCLHLTLSPGAIMGFTFPECRGGYQPLRFGIHGAPVQHFKVQEGHNLSGVC